MLRLVLLRDYLEYSDTFALWVHQQFAYEYSEIPLVDWQREFRDCVLLGSDEHFQRARQHLEQRIY